MSRVKWKGPYVKTNLLKRIVGTLPTSKKTIKTVSRNSLILPKFVGITVKIHNGKLFSILKITDDMVGYKLGEFFSTRKQFSYKKKKIIKNKI